ncbi:MAG: alpha/beta hydrolase [Caldimonas sp.]
MRLRRSAAVMLAVVVAGAVADAGAQSLLESFRARRAQGHAVQAPDPASAELESGDDPGGRYELPAGARAERDLAYGPAPAHRLDTYIPADARNAPILLMVHGGAWMFGDKANSGVVANKLKHWLPRGYIVVSPNYRMARPPNPLDQAEDVGRALAFVQANAASWGGDGARIVLMGHSSGAHLVALLTAAPAVAARSGVRPWLGTVSLDSAALDLVELMNARHPRLYDRVFGADPLRWTEVSPLHRLATRPVPMLLVCSSRRGDSCAAARRFASKAVSLGGRATVLPLDLGHGEINSELGRSPAYTASIDEFLRSLGLP